MEHIRYSVAACQTDLPNPIERREMRRNTERMLALIDAAVEGADDVVAVEVPDPPTAARS